MTETQFKPGLDLIVVNYKCPIDLSDFIQSLGDNSPNIDFNLFIVNVSPDYDSYRIGEVAKKLGITHIWKSENIGYARAVNLASTLGDREILGIFNADTRFLSPILDECYEMLMADPAAAVLGPRQIDPENRITHAGIFGTNSEPFMRGWREMNPGDHYADIRDDAVSVSGSAYFVKRSVWNEMMDCPIYRKSFPDALGAFMPSNLYYEETYLSYHVRKHGYNIKYAGNLTMEHAWHRAIKGGSGYSDEEMTPSRDMFRRGCDEHGIDRD